MRGVPALDSLLRRAVRLASSQVFPALPLLPERLLLTSDLQRGAARCSQASSTRSRGSLDDVRTDANPEIFLHAAKGCARAAKRPGAQPTPCGAYRRAPRPAGAATS